MILSCTLPWHAVYMYSYKSTGCRYIDKWKTKLTTFNSRRSGQETLSTTLRWGFKLHSSTKVLKSTLFIINKEHRNSIGQPCVIANLRWVFQIPDLVHVHHELIITICNDNGATLWTNEGWARLKPLPAQFHSSAPHWCGNKGVTLTSLILKSVDAR